MWRNKGLPGLASLHATPRRAATPSFHATTLSVLQVAALILLLYITDRSRCAMKWCNTPVLYVLRIIHGSRTRHTVYYCNKFHLLFLGVSLLILHNLT